MKNHTYDEQIQLKNKALERNQEETNFINRKLLKSNRTTNATSGNKKCLSNCHPNIDHCYSNNLSNLRQEIKNKLSEKLSKEKRATKCG